MVKRHFLFLLLFALSVWLGGCRPAAKTLPPWPQDVPEGFSRSGLAPLPAKWWQSFDDPALEALIEEGINQNFTIRSAWDRLRQAEAIAARTGATLLPDANYTGSARRSRQELNDKTLYSTRYSVGLAAAYEVDVWGRVHSSVQAAALDAAAAQEEVYAAAITLSANIARTWYQLVESRLQERLIADQIHTNENVLSIITLQFRQGQVGAANLFRQQQFVESTRGQLINAQERTALLTHQLAILVGKTPGVWQPQNSDRLILPAELPSTGIPSETLMRRPDLRSAAQAIAAADYRVYAAAAEQYPRISLSAGVETDAARTRDLFDNWLATLAANVVGPLFDGGARRAETERTRAVLSERMNAFAQRVLTAIGEVEDALRQDAYQRQSIANIQQQLVLAERVYERTRENYLKGQLDYLRVLDALASRQSLQRNELTERRLLLEYRINLCRAIAGGWPMERPEIAQTR